MIQEHPLGANCHCSIARERGDLDLRREPVIEPPVELGMWDGSLQDVMRSWIVRLLDLAFL